MSFGYVSDAFGRRKSFVTYLLVAAALILVYGSTRTLAWLLVIGPLTTFFVRWRFAHVSRRALPNPLTSGD